MNREQASLRERERFQQEFVAGAIKRRQAGLEIETILAGKRRHPEEVGWHVQADSYVGLPPAGELRHKVAADQTMELEKKCVIESGLCELAILDSSFQCKNVVR